MSRKLVFSLIVGYFVAALAVSLFIETQKPFASFSITNAAFLARVLGGAIGIYAMSGAIPVVVWAFFRFRTACAHGPLIAWGLLTVLASVLTEEGYRFDREQRIRELASQTLLAGRDRDDFIRAAKLACVERQQQSSLNRQAGATIQQIAAYCDCVIGALARSITIDEVVDMAKNGKPSASLQEKGDRLAPGCSRSVLGR